MERVCVFVCVWKRGRRINRCSICHGDICVPWRSSRSPLYLCNLQLSALTSFRPPLAPTTRPARPKGLGYKFKSVRKIERARGLGVQKWWAQRAAGESKIKGKRGCGRYRKKWGKYETKRGRTNNEAGITEKMKKKRKVGNNWNDWQRKVEVEQKRNKSLQEYIQEGAHGMVQRVDSWMIRQQLWKCSEVLKVSVTCFSSLFQPVLCLIVPSSLFTPLSL